jgi:protein-tyrosine phosphatase
MLKISQDDLSQRHIPLKGATNFRDLGGYVGHEGRLVQWRKIFRSDHLAFLNDQDLSELKTLGIQTSLDFRGEKESQAQAYAWPDIKRHSLSIEPTVVQRLQSQHLMGRPLSAADALDAMQTTYRDFVRLDSHRFAQMFDHLLTTSKPLLIHCTAGKDRTGLAGALILSALGVSEEDIWKDYLLTNQLYKRNSTGTSTSTLSPEVLKIVWEVQPSFLEAALEVIQSEHGGMPNYLATQLGLTPAAQQKLRQLYLA